MGAAIRVSNNRVYNPKHVMKWRKQVAWAAQRVKPQKLLTGAIRLTLEVWRPIPTKMRKREKDLAREGKLLPTVKPDLKNYLSAVEDALTGVIWEDDAQVVDSIQKKRYSETPGVRIVVEEISEDSQERENPR